MNKEKQKLALSGVERIIPELRFPEFKNDGDWEIRSIEKNIDMISGIALKSKELSEDKSGIPILRGINITEGHIRHSQKIDRFYLGDTSEINKYLVDENDIVIGMDGSKVGKNVALVSKFDNGSILIQRVARIRAIDSDINYLYQNFISKRFITYVNNVNTSSGIPHISAKQIRDYETGFPPTPKEQQKIANCLSSLDNLITAETEKLDHLKDHKKGLLQQLFPANGETKPQYRFPEFEGDGDWVVKSFEELFIIGNGRDYKHLSEGNVPVYGSGGYMRSVNEYLYDGESVCIGRKGTINKPIFLTGRFWTVDTLFYTHSFEDCIPKFIYLIFQKINWLTHNEAGGVPSLSKTNLHKINVQIPLINEQEKIVYCFNEIDALIESQTTKIEALKAHKKGLMQQLFPNVNS